MSKLKSHFAGYSANYDFLLNLQIAYFLTFDASSSALAFARFSLFPTRRASLHALRNLTYCSTSFSESSILRSETAGAAVGRGIGIAVLD